MLFYSNVFSLMDWEQEGINPCTGMYIRHIPIADISANNLLGPSITLAIRFNAFNATDYGFGTGWELNLTHIDSEQPSDETKPAITTLVLANGERYRLQTDASGSVSLKYKRTNTFQIFNDAKNVYTVVHKNGITETIENGRISTLRSANGKQIHFTWCTDNSLRITDDSGAQLLSTVIVTLRHHPHPKNSSASSNYKHHIITTARGIVTFICNQTGIPRLERVIQKSGTSSTLLCSIDYGYHNSSYLQIYSWRSYIDHQQDDLVNYTALPSPQGLDKSVPVVSSIIRTIISRIGQPKKTRTITFKYGEKNYLGYPDVTTWSDVTDNLEGLPDSFSYQTTEIVGDVVLPAITTTRTYNKFYLLTKHSPRGHDKSRTKDDNYAYKLVANTGIDAQSAVFMLPTNSDLVCTTQTGKGSRQTIFSTTWEYDDYANVTKNSMPSGLTEWQSYYAAEGETASDGTVLCPPSANGFIRYLKSTTLSSGASPDSTPKKKWQYTYSKTQDTHLVQINEEKFFLQQETPQTFSPVALKKTAYQYDNSGRPIAITSNMARITPLSTTPIYLSTTTRFSYIEDMSTGTATIKKETTGYDSSTIKKTESLTQKYVTADTISITDTDGLVSCFEYDIQGRVTKSTSAKGTKNEATSTATFKPAFNQVAIHNTSAQFTETTVSDNAGNTIETLRALSATQDGASQEYIFATFTYNDLDQLITKNELDYIRQSSPKTPPTPDITQTTIYEWNAYGEILSAQNPDGSKELYTYDAHSKDGYQTSIAITYYPGKSKTITYYNNNNQPCLQETYATLINKAPDTIQKFTYDHFMRQRTQTLSGRETFTYEYDAFDRVIVKNGTSSGRQTLVYASHSAAPLVVTLAVDDIVIGERTYDGLDREISSTINSVQTQYSYAGTAIFSRPSLVSITGGRQWKYEYNAALNQTTKKSILSSTSVPMAVLTFDYAPDSGLLQKETITQRGYTYFRTFLYDTFNHIKEESAFWDSDALGKYKTSITNSIRGKPIELSVKFNNNTTTISKKSVYSNKGFITDISYSLSDKSATNKILSFSRIHRSTSTGNITRIDNYARTIYNNFRLITQSIDYNSYNLKKSISYHLFSHPVFGCEMKYNRHHQLEISHYNFSARNAYQWSENYKYNDRGTLASWKRYGSTTYQNEYGNMVLQQSFTLDKLGNISAISSELQNGRCISSHHYENKFQLKKIQNSITSGHASTPQQVNFNYDAEGNTTSQTYQIQQEKFEEYYYYNGDKNMTSLVSNHNGALSHFYYYHDAEGRNIWTSLYNESASINSASIYVEGRRFIEQHREGRTGPTSFTLYHLVEGEILFITEVNSEGEEVRPCLNGPHGTPVVEGRQYITYQISHTDTRKFYHYYNFHIRGQNAYGLTFDLGASEYDANRGAFLPEK